MPPGSIRVDPPASRLRYPSASPFGPRFAERYQPILYIRSKSNHIVLSATITQAAYVALFAGSGVTCLAAIPRALTFDNVEVRRGIVGVLLATGMWGMFKTAFFVVPEAFREPAYIVGLIFGFATIWAWLYFCSAYTGRTYHRRRTVQWASVAVFLAVVSVKLTNPIHGLYFTTREATEPFAYLAIEHGLFHWAVTGLSYVLTSIGLFMLFELYLNSEYDTRPLTVLIGLLAIPVVVDVAALATPRLINVIYAPIGVAAFSVGVLFVFERRFLAVQNTGGGDDPSIYLDEDGYIRDYSSAAAAIFPALEGSVGKPLSASLPAVAGMTGEDEPIVEREHAGERRYYLVSMNTVALGDSGIRMLTFSDVTETERQRRQLLERERELNEQNERYRAIIAASFGVVARIDPDGRVLYVSPSVEEFLGYTAAELEGKPITATLPDADTAEWAREQMDTVLEGNTTQTRDFPLETNAGRTVYTDIRAVPIYDQGVPSAARTPADIVSVQLMVRDATNRRQREGLISVINRVLRHNVRNEMTVIGGYAEMLEAELDDEIAAKARHIGETADRLLELSESAQLLEQNRDLSPELEAIDIVPVVERIATQLGTRYPDAAVTVEAPDSAVAMTGPRVETGLWELIENAAKHGGDPPTVDLEVTVTDTQVRVAVSDDGPGLPETERQVLEAGKEEPLVHGQGLGLWLAYWLVTNLDGTIDVTTSEAGTTVEVGLPRPS